MNNEKETKTEKCRFCGRKAVEYTEKGWLCVDCLREEDDFHAIF